MCSRTFIFSETLPSIAAHAAGASLCDIDCEDIGATFRWRCVAEGGGARRYRHGGSSHIVLHAALP